VGPCADATTNLLHCQHHAAVQSSARTLQVAFLRQLIEQLALHDDIIQLCLRKLDLEVNNVWVCCCPELLEVVPGFALHVLPAVICIHKAKGLVLGDVFKVQDIKRSVFMAMQAGGTEHQCPIPCSW